MAYSIPMGSGSLESPTASITNYKLTPVVQSRSVGAVVAAKERNTNATADAPALETVVTKDCFQGWLGAEDFRTNIIDYIHS